MRGTTEVKICGFTRERDLRAACELGVNMVGVIVGFPGSPRDLSLERAKDVLRAADEGVEKVVVTPARLATKVCASLEPDYLQLHGCGPDQVRSVREVTGAKLIGVVAVPRATLDAGEVMRRALAMEEVADLLLLDTGAPVGGTG
ncbi:MAG: phosphoribosylanthranilate isomerase, partial [Hadesarchaea archaeon]|nr:phosphoribosylanthranilate isomerase [Hadesarchaea archaeon]